MQEFYETRDDLLADFVSENPAASGVSPSLLYSTLVRENPDLPDRVRVGGAPDFSTERDVLDFLRQRNPELSHMPQDEFSRQFRMAQPDIARSWGIGDGSEPPDEFEQMFGIWYGRRPQKPLEEYEFGKDLRDIGEKNLRGRQGFVESFLGTRGLTRDWAPYLSDVLDATEIAKIIRISKKLEDGDDSDVTDDELVRFNYYMQRVKREDEGGWRSMAGSVVRTSILFGGEMALSVGQWGWFAGGAGAAKLAKEATIESLKAAGRAAGKRTMKELVEDASVGAAKSLIKRGVGAATKSPGLLSFSTRTASARAFYRQFGKEVKDEVTARLGGGLAARTAGRAAGFLADVVPQTGYGVAQKTAIELLGTAAAGEDPTTSTHARMRLQALFNGEDDPSLAAATGDLMIEYASEMMGPYLGGMLGAGARSAGRSIASKIASAASSSGAGKKAVDRTVGKMARWLAVAGGKAKNFTDAAFRDSKFMQTLVAHGYDGVVEEMLEERAGGFLRGLTGLEGDEHRSYLANVWNATMPQSTDQFLAELVAFSIPGAVNAAGLKIGSIVSGRADKDYEKYAMIGNLAETGRNLWNKKSSDVPAPGKNAEGKASESPILEPSLVDLVNGNLAVLKLDAAEEEKTGGLFGFAADFANALASKFFAMQYITQESAEKHGVSPGWHSTAQAAASRAGSVSIFNNGRALLRATLNASQAYKDAVAKAGSPNATEAEKQAVLDIVEAKQREVANAMAISQVALAGVLDLGPLRGSERKILEAGGLRGAELDAMEAKLAKLRTDKTFLGHLAWDPVHKRIDLSAAAQLAIDDPTLFGVVVMRNAHGHAPDGTDPTVRQPVDTLVKALKRVVDAPDPVRGNGVAYARALLAHLAPGSEAGERDENLLSLAVGATSPILNPSSMPDADRAGAYATGKSELLEILQAQDPSGADAAALDSVAKLSNPAFVSGGLTFSAQELSVGPDGRYRNMFEAFWAMLAGRKETVDPELRAQMMVVNGYDPSSPLHQADFDEAIARARTALEVSSSRRLWKDQEVVLDLPDGRTVPGVITALTRNPKDPDEITSLQVASSENPSGKPFEPRPDSVRPRAAPVPYVTFAFGASGLRLTRAEARAKYPEQYNQIASQKAVKTATKKSAEGLDVPDPDNDVVQLSFGASVGLHGNIYVNLFSSSHLAEDVLESGHKRYNEALHAYRSNTDDEYRKKTKLFDAVLDVPSWFRDLVSRTVKEYNDRVAAAGSAEKAGVADDPFYKAFVASAPSAPQFRNLTFELFGKLYKRHSRGYKDEIDERGRPVFHALDEATDRFAAMLGDDLAATLTQQHAFYLKFLAPEVLDSLRLDFGISNEAAPRFSGQRPRPKATTGDEVPAVYVERGADGRVVSARPAYAMRVEEDDGKVKRTAASVWSASGSYEPGFRAAAGSRSILAVGNSPAVSAAFKAAVDAARKLREATETGRRAAIGHRADMDAREADLRRKEAVAVARIRALDAEAAAAVVKGEAPREGLRAEQIQAISDRANIMSQLDDLADERRAATDRAASGSDIAEAAMAYRDSLAALTSAVAANDKSLRPVVESELGDEVPGDSISPDLVPVEAAPRPPKAPPRAPETPDPSAGEDPEAEARRRAAAARIAKLRGKILNNKPGGLSTSELDAEAQAKRDMEARGDRTAEALKASMMRFRGAPPDRSIRSDRLEKAIGKGAKKAVAALLETRAAGMDPAAVSAWREEAGNALALLSGGAKRRSDVARLAVLAGDLASLGRLPGVRLPARVADAAEFVRQSMFEGTFGDASRGRMPEADEMSYDPTAAAALYHLLLTHPGLTRLQSVLGVHRQVDPGVAATVAFALAGVDGKNMSAVADFSDLVSSLAAEGAGEKAKYAAEAISVEDIDELAPLLAELAPEEQARVEFMSDSERAELAADPVLQEYIDHYFGPDAVPVMLAVAASAGDSSVNLAGNSPGARLDPFNEPVDFLALAAAGLSAEEGDRNVSVPASDGSEVPVPTEVALLVSALSRAGMSHAEFQAYSRRVLGVQNNLDNVRAIVSTSADGKTTVRHEVQYRSSRAARAVSASALSMKLRGLEDAIAAAPLSRLAALVDELNRAGLNRDAEIKAAVDAKKRGAGEDKPLPPPADMAGHERAMRDLVVGTAEIMARAAELNGDVGSATAARSMARSVSELLDAGSLAPVARMAARVVSNAARARRDGKDARDQASAFARTLFSGDNRLSDDDRGLLESTYGGAPKGANVAATLIEYLFRETGSAAIRDDSSSHRTPQIPPRVVSLVGKKFPSLLSTKGLRAGQLPIVKVDEASYSGRTVVVADMEASARARLAVAFAKGIKADPTGAVLVPVTPGVRQSLYLLRMDAAALDALADDLLKRYPGAPARVASALGDKTAEGRFIAAQWAMVASQFGEDSAEAMLSSNDLVKRLGLVNGTVQATAAPGKPLAGLLVDRIEVDGEVLPKSASDGHQYALPEAVASQLDVSGGAFKITAAGHAPGGRAGVQITGMKPAGTPEAVASDQAAAEALLGEALPGDLSFGFLSVESEVKSRAPAGFGDFVMDAGAVKSRGAEVTVDGEGADVPPIRFRVGGHDVAVYAKKAWMAAENVAKVSEVADEADRGSTAFGVSAALNLDPYAPEAMRRVREYFSWGYENLAAMPADELAKMLDAYVRESVAKSTPAAAYAVDAAGYAVDNFLVRAEFAAASMLRENARPLVEYLYNLVAPSMQTVEVAVSGGDSYLWAAKDGKPAGVRLNDAREDAAFSIWTTDEFDAAFRTDADKTAAIRRLLEAMRALRDSTPTAQEVSGMPAEALAEMYARRGAAVSELFGMSKYFTDFTQSQRLTFLEDTSGFFRADGSFREHLVASRIAKDGKLRTTLAPQPGMFERFPGSTGMTSRDAPQVTAPATLAVRKIRILGEDGKVRVAERVASGTANLLVMDVHSLKNRGIDNDADKHRMSFAVRPRGTPPTRADVHDRARRGALTRSDMQWMGYWAASEFVDSLTGMPDHVANAALAPDYGNGVELEVPAWLKEAHPASAELSRASGKELLKAKLHPLAALSFPAWEARALAAAEASDRGHVVQANDGMAAIAGMALDLSAEAGAFGSDLVRRELAPGLFLGAAGSRWRERGPLLQRVFDLGNNQVNSVIDAEKNWTEYLRGVTSDTSPMKYALIASWEPGFTLAQENEKRDELVFAALSAGRSEADGLADFDAWARATPGTMLHFEQSWTNFVETDPGMRLFLEASRARKARGEPTLYSWDQWVDEMTAYRVRQINASRGEGEAPVGRRDPKVRESVAASLGSVEVLFRVGDQIKRLGGVAKQYHNLGKSVVDVIRMRTDLEAIEKGGVRLSDADRARRLPTFPNLDIRSVSSDPFFGLQRSAVAALQKAMVEHSPIRHPAVVAAMQRAIDRKDVGGAYQIEESMRKSLARSAAIAAYPELAKLLNDVVLPYYAENSRLPDAYRALLGPDADAKMAARLLGSSPFRDEAEAELKRAGIVSPSEAQIEEKRAELRKRAEEEALAADSAAPAFALEQIASTFVNALLNDGGFASTHPELQAELSDYLAVRQHRYSPRGGTPLEESRSLGGTKLRATATLSDSALDVAAWHRVLDAVEAALLERGGLAISVKTAPMTQTQYKLRSSLSGVMQSEMSSLARKLLAEPAGDDPAAVAARQAKMEAYRAGARAGAFNPPGDRSLSAPLDLVVGAELVRPLLAYYGASAFQSLVGRTSGNPLSSMDSATLRKFADAFKAIAAPAFADDRATRAIRFASDVAGRRTAGMEDSEGRVPRVPVDIAPVVMADVAKPDASGRPFSGRVDVSPFITTSMLDAMARQNFRETKHQVQGEVVARPYPQDRKWDGVLEQLARADDLAAVGVFNDRLVESAVRGLAEVGRPMYGEAVRLEYDRMKAGAVAPRAPVSSPDDRARLEALHPETLVELEAELVASGRDPRELAAVRETMALRGWKDRLAKVRRGEDDVYSARWLDEASRAERRARDARPDIQNWDAADPIFAVAGWVSAKEAESRDPNPLIRRAAVELAADLAVSASLGDFDGAYRAIETERNLPAGAASAFRRAVDRAALNARVAADTEPDDDASRMTHSMVSYWELSAMYAAQRAAIGGIDYLKNEINRILNMQDAWNHRLEAVTQALGRRFADYPTRRTITRMTYNERDSKRLGRPVYDYNDKIFHRESTNVRKLTDAELNEQALMDYLVAAIMQGSEHLTLGSDDHRGVSMERGADGVERPTATVWVRDGRVVPPGTDRAREILQVNGWDAEAHKPTSAFLTVDFAIEKLMGSDYYRALLEYGRELSTIDIRRDADGKLSGGLVEYAKAISKELRDAMHDYRELEAWTGRAAEEGLVGAVENYLPQVFGGHGFEDAPRRKAREEVHRQARRKSTGNAGKNAVLPAAAFQTSFRDVGDARKPLAEQESLYERLSGELDALYLARKRRAPKLALATTKERAEWSRMQYNYALLRLAERVETEKAVAVGADAYQMPAETAELIRGLKRSISEYSDKEWSARRGKREYATYYEAFVSSSNDKSKPSALMMAITDPLRLATSSIRDLMDTLAKEILVNQFMLATDAHGEPLVLAFPREGAKDPNPANRGRDVRSLLREDTLRKQLSMLERKAGRAGRGNTVYEKIRDLIDSPDGAVNLNKYKELKSDYESIDKFYVLVDEKGGKTHVRSWFEHVVGRPAQWNVKFGGEFEHDVLRIAAKANQFMKQMAVGWSLFFATSGVESLVAATPFQENMANLLQPKIRRNWRDLKALGRRVRRGDMEIAMDLYKYHKAGIMISERNISDDASSVVDEVIAKVSRAFGDRFEGSPERRAAAERGARTVLRTLAGRRMSEWLMGDFFGGMKLWATRFMIDEFHRKNPHLSEDAVLRIVAPIVNDAFGGQNWHRYWWATPKVLSLLNLIMFAPNWTISAANVGGLGLLTGDVLGNHMSPEQAAFVARNWAVMYLVALQLVPNLLQAAIYGLGHALPGDPDDEKQEKEDRMFAWFNEQDKGQFFPSIDITPLMRKVPGYSGDPTGRRRVYVRFGKQSYEVLQGWLKDPGKTFGGKTSMLVKAVWEQATGYAPGSPEFELPFRSAGAVLGLVDSDIGFRGSRIGTLLSKALPMTISSAISNPDAFLTAIFVPASKGISQTRAVQGMIALLEGYAEGGPTGRFRWTPDQQANLDALAARYVDALERNGYDPDQVATMAKGAVLPSMYADFYEGFVRKDAGRMHAAARRIYRVAGTAEGLLRSVIERQEKTGRRRLTDEEKDAVRLAFEEAIPPLVRNALED